MATKTVTLVTPPTRTGDTIASYNIYSDETGLLDNATPAELAGGHVVSLADGTDHDIYVKTVWTTYGESAQGSNSELIDLSIAAPTVLAVGTPTYNTIPLTWTKTVTGAMTSYKVYDDGVLLQTFAGDVASGTLTGLTPSTAYTNLTVRAFNGTYESVSSNAVNGTTLAFNAPTLLAVGTPTDTTIPLTWTKSTSGVMTEYRAYIGGVLTETFAGDVALGTITGLAPETVYAGITVRAFNGTIESASSNAVSGTTTA